MGLPNGSDVLEGVTASDYEILEKPLPRTPTWLHPTCRESAFSFYYRRAYLCWQKLNGYHFGAMCCASTSAVVLLINLITTIWASVKYNVRGGIGTIQEGDCAATSNLGFWLHLLINALSTLLLGASNYSMQCLSSPTRPDVDRAHRLRIWVDIGVPSVRNLRRISVSRIAVWWLLAVSTIPLHLFWNSAVFSSLYAREYDVFVVPADFPNGPQVNFSVGGWSDTVQQQYSDMRRNPTSLQKLENKACLKAYSGQMNSARGDVILVSSYHSDDQRSPSRVSDRTIFQILPGFISSDSGPGQWICNDPSGFHCDVEKSASQGVSWVFDMWHVQHCLSEKVEEHCKLQFSAVIMIVVIVCNFVKLCCMSWVVFQHGPEPLVTLGDAIASFLNEPDETTDGSCLADKYHYQHPHLFCKQTIDNEIRRQLGLEVTDLQETNSNWEAGPRFWLRKRRFWFSAASKARWIICNGLCLVTLCVVGGLLSLGLSNGLLTSTSISYLYSLGFGNLSSQSMISPGVLNFTGSGGILLVVLISNSPQIILSFLYLAYNSLFTCMLIGHEWSGYAEKRKTLRVTTAKGQQRTTYYLQLPYRYGIPLLVGSATLHWLVSQSIFLARVTVVDETGVEDASQSISGCGYSNIAIIFVLILGGFIILIVLAHGFWSYEGKMPIAGSCSAVISAACHPPEGDTNASTKPIMWGAVDAHASLKGNSSTIGHCSFSSFDVSTPVKGRLYAGRRGVTAKQRVSSMANG